MKFKELRESKNMTQDELASKLGVKRTTVSMWESGLSLPRADKLISISKILDCTVDELLED